MKWDAKLAMRWRRMATAGGWMTRRQIRARKPVVSLTLELPALQVVDVGQSLPDWTGVLPLLPGQAAVAGQIVQDGAGGRAALLSRRQASLPDLDDQLRD